VQNHPKISPNHGKCNREPTALIYENLQFDLENVRQGQSTLCHQIRLAKAYNSRYCYAYRIPYRFRVMSDFRFRDLGTLSQGQWVKIVPKRVPGQVRVRSMFSEHICEFFEFDLENWVKVKL
jgi:hypothetical protein